MSYFGSPTYFTIWYPVRVAFMSGATHTLLPTRVYPGVRMVCERRGSRFWHSCMKSMVSKPGVSVKRLPSELR